VPSKVVRRGEAKQELRQLVGTLIGLDHLRCQALSARSMASDRYVDVDLTGEVS
jgi:hypothetical protein